MELSINERGLRAFGPVVDVIIPALNEAEAIAKVIGDVPSDLVHRIIVVDNGSSDETVEVAERAGAIVLHQPIRGYGAACLMGIGFLATQSRQPDTVVFLDGDYSDHPEELPRLVDPITNDEADMVIGSRTLGNRTRGSLTPQQVFGNRVATVLLKWIYGYSFTDLGPFRAIRWDKLQALGMKDMNYGWTVEMQVKAAKQALRCREVPVSYRQRIGKSKVSGTLKGSILAGYKILLTLFKYV